MRPLDPDLAPALDCAMKLGELRRRCERLHKRLQRTHGAVEALVVEDELTRAVLDACDFEARVFDPRVERVRQRREMAS